MNAIAESRGSAVVARATLKFERYDRVMKTMHWTTLFLVAATYAVVWSSGAAATKEQQAVLVQVHRSLGVTIFVLTLFRLAWRSRARLPSLPADLPTVQIMASKATQYLLYALLLVQPVLGLLHSIALAGCGKNQSWGAICRIMTRGSPYSCRDPVPRGDLFRRFAGFSRLWPDSGRGYAFAGTSFVSRTRL